MKSFLIPSKLQKPSLFGQPANSKSALSPVTRSLNGLEARPLLELVLKDIAAFNVPKITLARTWKERIDTATLELSNTTITLVSSLCLPALMRLPVSRLTGFSTKELTEGVIKTPAFKMARLAVSFGFFFPFAAAFWAAPFFRNWLTIKRTNGTNFESMIGFQNANTAKATRSIEAEKDYQSKTALGIMAIGTSLGVASLVGLGSLARAFKNPATTGLAKNLLSKLENEGAKKWHAFYDAFDLKGKSANQISGQSAQLIFWGLPAYLGWIHGARSGNERRERFIQSLNAIFWFFFASKLTRFLWTKPFQSLAGQEHLWSKAFKNELAEKKISLTEKLTSLKYEDILKHFEGSPAIQEKLLRLKHGQFLLNDLGIPITSLTAVQFFNFNLTEKAIQKSQPLPPKQEPGLPVPALPRDFSFKNPQPFAGNPSSTWGIGAHPLPWSYVMPPNNPYTGNPFPMGWQLPPANRVAYSLPPSTQ